MTIITWNIRSLSSRRTVIINDCEDRRYSPNRLKTFLTWLHARPNEAGQPHWQRQPTDETIAGSLGTRWAARRGKLLKWNENFAGDEVNAWLVTPFIERSDHLRSSQIKWAAERPVSDYYWKKLRGIYQDDVVSVLLLWSTSWMMIITNAIVTLHDHGAFKRLPYNEYHERHVVDRDDRLMTEYW